MKWTVPYSEKVRTLSLLLLLFLISIWMGGCGPYRSGGGFYGDEYSEPEFEEMRFEYPFQRDRNGYSLPQPGADTQVLYVSNAGDDSNSGTGADRPFKTIGKARSLLRDGKADWILLKSGKVFSGNSLSGWSNSGASPQDPDLISAYGEGERPILDRMTWSTHGHQSVNFIALIGLRFTAASRDPQSPSYRPKGSEEVYHIRALAPGRGLWIEDCEFDHGSAANVDVEGDIYDFVFRKNIVRNAYRRRAGGSGIYVSNYPHVESNYDSKDKKTRKPIKKGNPFLIEDNFFDHNGWLPEAGAPATMFGHHLYLAEFAGRSIVRRNIFARAGASGIQQRAGGLVENNLFVDSALAVMVGTSSSAVRGNVILGGRDINKDLPRGFGIESSKATSVEISDNIVANKYAHVGHGPAIFLNYNTTKGFIAGTIRPIVQNPRVEIFNNVIHDWHGGLLFRLVGGDIQLTGNHFSDSDKKRRPVDIKHKNARLRNSENSWQMSKLPKFKDPDRSIESYLRTMGQPGTMDDFLARLRLQSRRRHDPRLRASAINQYIREGFASER